MLKKLFNLSKKSLGFTTLEIAFVMAITALVVAAGIGININLKLSRINDVPLELIQRIRLAQNQAFSGVNNLAHGIYFESGKYILYQGPSYAERQSAYDQEFKLNNNLVLCWQLTGEKGESNEINFAKGSGMPNNTGLIFLTDIANNITKAIEVNYLGGVAYAPMLEEYCSCSAAGELMCQEVAMCHHSPIDPNTSEEIKLNADEALALCWVLYEQDEEKDFNLISPCPNADEKETITLLSAQDDGNIIINVDRSFGRKRYKTLLSSYCACEGYNSEEDNNENEDKGTIIYVENGIIHGGPDDGQAYAGVLNGTNQNDIIAGTYQGEIINGGNGDDIIFGSEGNNIIQGGNGKDIIFSKSGNDSLNDDNGKGAVITRGGNNNINVSENNAKDVVISGPGNDKIYGGNGKDIILSLGGNNEIYGGYGKDLICSGNGLDIIDAGYADDQISSNGEIDTINGSQGNFDICLNGENISGCEDTSTIISECEGLSYYTGDEIPVCHYPINNRYITETLYVRPFELSYHLSHGDVLGVCGDDLFNYTIMVNAINIPWHLKHEDTLGACEE